MKKLVEVANEMFPDGTEYNIIDRTLFYNGGVKALDMLSKECEKEGIMTKRLSDIITELKSDLC